MSKPASANPRWLSPSTCRVGPAPFCKEQVKGANLMALANCLNWFFGMLKACTRCSLRGRRGSRAKQLVLECLLKEEVAGMDQLSEGGQARKTRRGGNRRRQNKCTSCQPLKWASSYNNSCQGVISSATVVPSCHGCRAGGCHGGRYHSNDSLRSFGGGSGPFLPSCVGDPWVRTA